MHKNSLPRTFFTTRIPRHHNLFSQLGSSRPCNGWVPTAGPLRARRPPFFSGTGASLRPCRRNRAVSRPSPKLAVKIPISLKIQMDPRSGSGTGTLGRILSDYLDVTRPSTDGRGLLQRGKAQGWRAAYFRPGIRFPNGECRPLSEATLYINRLCSCLCVLSRAAALPHMRSQHRAQPGTIKHKRRQPTRGCHSP